MGSWRERIGKNKQDQPQQRIYNAAIVNLLGYLAEKTDLLPKLIELESASYKDPTKRKNSIRRREQNEKRAHALILSIVTRHISPSNEHFADLLVPANDGESINLVKRAEEIAGFSGKTAAKQHDKQKTWEWRNIAGKVAIDLLMEMKAPQAQIGSLLTISMQEALRIRDIQEEAGNKKTNLAFKALNADFQRINVQLFDAYRNIRQKPDPRRPMLNNEGDALLWVTKSISHPNYSYRIDHLDTVINELAESYNHKPSVLLKGFYYVVLDLIDNDRTHEGDIDRRSGRINATNEMYTELGG